MCFWSGASLKCNVLRNVRECRITPHLHASIGCTEISACSRPREARHSLVSRRACT